MSNEVDQTRLSELASLLCDDLITDEQFDELDSILSQSPEARKWYHIYVANHSALESDILTENRQDNVTAPISIVNAEGVRLRWAATLTAAAAILIASLAVFSTIPQGRNDIAITDAPIALVTHISDVIWSDNAEQLSLGDSVQTGHLKLKSGLIRLQYEQGAVLSLIGPADFEIIAADHAILHHGELAAYVTSAAKGFRVDTPGAGVVDLGTEFGLTVNQQGDTQLSVFDGEVELSSSQPDSDATIVSAGHAYNVDSNGLKERSSGLAPYKDARDSLRGWQIVWEPFGPGSPTGNFPGRTGAGWLEPWKTEVSGGAFGELATGVLSKKPLAPGAEVYCNIKALPHKSDMPVCAVLSRAFGSIDQFVLTRPVTIEMLVRLQSNPDVLERFRVYGTSVDSDGNEQEIWSLEAGQDAGDGKPTWKLPKSADEDNIFESLPIGWWSSYRCLIEIDPNKKIWRAAVANPQKSIANGFQDLIPLTGHIGDSVTLCFEATGKPGQPVQFAVDGIRIQNHPDYSATQENRAVSH